MKCSISQQKLFKSCRRAWWLRYKEKLIPVATPDALETGRTYHKYIEMLENGEELPDDFTRERAMAEAYKKYILPQFKVTATEKFLETEIGDHVLYGFLDGIADDGNIVEHKTTSRDITGGGEYEYNLLWDEQILAYMALTGARKVYYTVCRKPTIRLKKGESEEEFYQRMVAWYDDDTAHKITVYDITRTDEEVEAFKREFENVCAEIQEAEFDADKIYRNTCHCNTWGRRCEYSAVCLNYNPDETYVEYYRDNENPEAIVF